MRIRNLLLLVMLCSINLECLSIRWNKEVKREFKSKLEINSNLYEISQRLEEPAFIHSFLSVHGGGYYPYGMGNYYTLDDIVLDQVIPGIHGRDIYPILINRYKNEYYMVLKKEWNFLADEPFRDTFLIYKLINNQWLSINYDEFPKQIAYQNMNLWLVHCNRNDLFDTSIFNSKDVKEIYFDTHFNFIQELDLILKKTAFMPGMTKFWDIDRPLIYLEIFRFWSCLEYNDCEQKDHDNDRVNARVTLKFVRDFYQKNLSGKK